MRILLTICVLLIALTFANGSFAANFDVDFDTDDTQTFYVALPHNATKIDLLKQKVLDISDPDSPNYGQWLTQTQINQYTKSSSEHIDYVGTWLRNNGATTLQFQSKGGDAYRVVMPTSKFLKHFPVNRKTNVSNVLIPKELKDHVVLIELLNNSDEPLWKRKWGPHRRRKWGQNQRESSTGVESSAAIADPGVVAREVLMRVYNVPDNGFVNSSLVSAGSMEFQGGEGFSQKDMLKVQVASDVPENPVSQQHLLGVNSDPADGESELDMAVIWMSAANVTLWYSDYPGWMYAWAVNFFERESIPQVMSISWGWNELDQCGIGRCDHQTSTVYVQRANVEFMKLTARGATIVVASGDAGSPGRTNELCDPNYPHINPVFPGGSPWVLSVGATYIRNSNTNHSEWKSPVCKLLGCANGTSEGVTTYGVTGWTSGAGFTRTEPTPVWQKSHVDKYLASGVQFPEAQYFNAQGRAYPDLVVFGHNCAMYNKYGWTTEDGTSCSAPIMAGIISYLNNHQLARGRNLLGFVNPMLYKMYERRPQIFTDITRGNSSCTEQSCCGPNYGFVPASGMWDVVSGLGSPNIAGMISFLDSQSPKAPDASASTSLNTDQKSHLYDNSWQDVDDHIELDEDDCIDFCGDDCIDHVFSDFFDILEDENTNWYERYEYKWHDLYAYKWYEWGVPYI